MYFPEELDWMHDIFYAMLPFLFLQSSWFLQEADSSKAFEKPVGFALCIMVVAAILCLILKQKRKFTTGPFAGRSAHIIRVKPDGTEQQKHWHSCLAQESSLHKCKIAFCNVSFYWF